jgi:4-hydroxythreonine-4-phosphate dehydrogenase
MKPRIAIATGDPGGIGPEVSLKAALHPVVLSLCSPVLVGDRGALEVHAELSRISLKDLQVVERRQLGPGELKIGQVDAVHGRAALDSAEAAIRGALAGEYEAVVAAPHTEAAVRAAGVDFDGYPSFVAKVAGLAPEEGVLMLCFAAQGREYRIAHVTLHAAVSDAAMMISTGRVLKTLRAVHSALEKIGIERPRMAVSGLNPHAAGIEEERKIVPAVAAARGEGMEVDGPFGADTFLARAEYDAHVVMLHDQGHVAAKLLAPNGAAALTVGTPVLFSSVAHGSALDIAGKGIADARAMVEAITRLVSRRRRPSATSNCQETQRLNLK